MRWMEGNIEKGEKGKKSDEIKVTFKARSKEDEFGSPFQHYIYKHTFRSHNADNELVLID